MKCTIKCPHCGQQYEDIEYVPGQKAECESCQQSFVICMSLVVDTHAKSSLITELYDPRQNSVASPVESWLESKNGNKREAGKNNEIWMADWQKSIKNNQINKSDLVYFNSVNHVIYIWDKLSDFLMMLFALSIFLFFIYLMIQVSKEKLNLLGTICAIGATLDILLNWLICKSVKVVLESFRAMNYNAEIIASSITNLKDSKDKN